MNVEETEIARFRRRHIAEAFVQALEREGFEAYIKPHEEGFSVYCATQAAAEARAFLQNWLNVMTKQQQQKAWQTGAPTEVNHGFYVRQNAFKHWWQRFGVVTKLIFIAAVVVFLLPYEWQKQLLFPSDLSQTSTQPWRLISPMLLHFSVMHLVFNLLFWMELGGVIERFQSSQQLLFVTIITALVSSVAQFFSTGANFGGLSGVVYGLLGYLWLYGMVNPAAGYRLRREIVVAMLVWLVFCYIVLADIVANEAHLFGLVSGAVLGALVGWYRRWRYYATHS